MARKNDLKDPKYDAFVSSMLEVAERYKKIQEQQCALGLFSYDRELVKCHVCKLSEDINFIGKLFTYRYGDIEFKDTGLQFISLDEKNECFKCPDCGAECLVLPEPSLKEENT